MGVCDSNRVEGGGGNGIEHDLITAKKLMGCRGGERHVRRIENQPVEEMEEKKMGIREKAGELLGSA